MRSIVYIVLVMSLMVACSTDEVGMGNHEGRPIALSVYTSQPIATRADSAVMADRVIPTGKSIGVYAYYHDNSTWTADDAAEPKRTVPNFMCNQQATCEGADAGFSYSPLKYWPNEESDKVSFIAYYPYSHGDAGLTATGIASYLHNLGALVDYGAGMPVFRFTVKSNVKQQVDFMVSDLIPDMPYSRDTDPNPGDPFDNLTITDRVRFNFKHATSKIEFRVVVDEDIRKDLSYFTLKSISMTNIYREGLLTTSYNGGTGETTLTWSGHSSSLMDDYSCKTTEAYLLLPQTLRNDAVLTIGYDLAFKSDGTSYTYDASGNLVPTEEYKYTNRSTSVQLNTLKLSGSGTPLTEWLPNHHYVYTIRLGGKAIEFTGQVVDWGDRVAADGIEIVTE